MGEFVPTEAPLEGELAAQLTEGSRLGLWPSLAPEAQIPGFWNIRVCIPPPAEAFLKKSRTPQTRLSPGQLRSALRVRKPRAATASIPSRGAKGLYEFARGFSAPVLRTAPHPPLRRSPFPDGEGWGFPSGGYGFPKASPPGGAPRKSFPSGEAGRAKALTDEGRYRLTEPKTPGEFVYRKSRNPQPSPAGEGVRMPFTNYPGTLYKKFTHTPLFTL